MRCCACLVMLWAVLCATAVPAATRFTDVTAASGITIAQNTGVGGTNPHAVTVEDFNGDGLHDIIIPTFGAPHVRYFRNLGGLKFADATRGSGLESFAGDGTGAAVADYDRDGHRDVYLTSLRQGASRLYRNRGDGTFEDVSHPAGVLLAQPSRSCAFSDVDGDGWIDLYITSPSGPNVLFLNRGNGTFRRADDTFGAAIADGHSLSCVFGDADGDGRDDLFVTNYQSQVSRLLRSTGPAAFRDQTEQAGLSRRASSVGAAWGDVFNQRRLDLFVTTDSWLSGANYTEDQLRQMGHTVEPNALYVNQGGGRFLPAKEPLFNYKSLSHDVILEDLDHDGWLDIYVGVDAESGNRWATSKGGNPLWTRVEGQWREVSKAWGVAHEANCVCVPAADFDNDGDLDLLLVNFYSNVVLYRNERNDRRWLQVQVVGTRSNRDGIGCKIEVVAETQPPKLAGYREIQSGGGYCRCSPLEAHIGLGAAPADTYRVRVVFPSGAISTRTGIKPAQRLVIGEGDDGTAVP